jgi:tetratricopeptide (TPR) repeat protein
MQGDDMKTRTLTQLVQVPADLDYVEHFQVLSGVNLEIRRHGPSAERLLRKAILEMDIGNYAASLAAAQDACALDPVSAETHHQVGLAYLLLAMAKAGAVPTGPGVRETPSESCMELLDKAIGALRDVVRLNPQDQETREDLGLLESWLALDSEAKLARTLRGALN